MTLSMVGNLESNWNRIVVAMGELLEHTKANNRLGLIPSGMETKSYMLKESTTDTQRRVNSVVA